MSQSGPGALHRLAPSSLTGRLIATLVLVVVVTSAVVALVSSLAMHSLLYSRLDEQVDDAVRRAAQHTPHDGAVTGRSPVDGVTGGDGDRDRPGFGVGDAGGTLNAAYFPGVANGWVVKDSGGVLPLSASALQDLRRVPADRRFHSVELPGVGPFHVKALAGSATTPWIVAGVSTHDADEAIASLVLWEALLALGAVVLAALAGRWLVRRQLRPLREVAATAHQVTTLPLSSGEIGTTVRVPAALTDERTEVGSVGAALNTMLEHVEHALDERHRSEQQVRRFVADASHELRTPLTTIHGYAELSRRNGPVDPVQLSRAMTKVEAAATRMSSLVEDLLLLARLDAGRPLARDEVDLTHLVLESVGDARVVGPEHRWLLDLGAEPVIVPGDEQRLHQVVTNLLGNARRHTPPGTSVRVGVHVEGDDAVLAVEDDGPGLSPDLVGTAFERFTRGDSSRTRESGGAGLGLSLVQAISAAHDGSVSVESAPGRTRFEVRLPGAPTPALAPTHR